jgi:rhodanese-related sulfurtransferase
MNSRSIASAVALGALALAFAAPGFAQDAAAPQKPAISPTPATAAAAKSDFDPAIARRLKVEDLKKRLDAGEKARYIDTRYSPTGAIIKGAEIVTFDKVGAWSANVPKDTFIVTYCTCHNEATSGRAVLELQKLGYTNAYALFGGLAAYQSANLPTETAPAPAQP